MRPTNNWKKTSTILKEDRFTFFSISVGYIEFLQSKKKMDIYLQTVFFQQRKNQVSATQTYTKRQTVQQKSSMLFSYGI